MSMHLMISLSLTLFSDPFHKVVLFQDGLVDDSPDSPDAPEDLPYVSLKRYV